MAIRYTSSADKHGIPHEDALHAIMNAKGQDNVQGHPGQRTMVFVGPPHPQTDRLIEVIVAQQGTDLVIFHAMPVTDIYRHLAE